MIDTPYQGFFSAAPSDATVQKPLFDSVPQRIRDDLCRLAGANAITHTCTVRGGVSASAAFLIDFDNATRFFVKGSHPQDFSHGAANLRGECMAYRSLDILRDVAPPFRGMVYADIGDDNGWWLGAWQGLDVFESPAYDVAHIFSLLDLVAQTDVSSTGDVALAAAHPYLSLFMNDTNKWQRLRDDAARAQKFSACHADPGAALSWLSAHLAQLCMLQQRAATHAWQLGLMHGDLRCDNAILARADTGAAARWYLIDWANAAEGPLAFDRVMLAASLHADGACDAQTGLSFARAGLAADDVTYMLVQQAGYFADQLYRAPPPALPRLRPMQRAMFWALMRLLAVAIGTVPPPAFATR